MGYAALSSNTTASNNTAVGLSALNANTTGHSNTAVGFEACKDNALTSNNNTGVGYKALENQTGTKNFGHGAYTLGNGTTGDWKILLLVMQHCIKMLRTNNTAVGNEVYTQTQLVQKELL